MLNTPICVDASLVVRLVADSTDEVVVALWQGWKEENRLLAAPTLLFYEVSNALYRYQKHNYLSAKAVDLALQAAQALPITLHGDPDLHRRALTLARRFALPAAYDAHYLALAERLGAQFFTADRRLVNTVGGQLDWVQHV
jgi:predicted nucleic acid-binding protein